MVEYDPSGEAPHYEDTTEEENFRLRRALDTLFSMIMNGRNLYDISRVASRLADETGWPYLRKVSKKLEFSVKEEEE